MKKFYLLLFLINSGISIFAQETNPFNERGIEFYKSLEIIAADIQSGIVTDFSDVAIKKYASNLPLEHTVSMDMVQSILIELKEPNKSFPEALQRSGISDFGHQTILKICNKDQLSSDELQISLSNLAVEVNDASVDSQERELLLSLIAIVYHNSGEAARNKSCDVIFPDGTMSTIPCWTAGMLVGAIIGYPICGVPCVLGGALVGGIVGYFS